MTSHVSIRPAIESDLEWILNELKDFSKFFNSKISLFPSDDYAREIFMRHITDHLFLVAVQGEQLIGFISGWFSTHLFNPSIILLTETFWWVPPAHRGSRAALMLLNEFTRIGKAHAHWITFALENHSPVNDRCLTKRGYTAKEKSYILEVTK